MSQRPLVVGLLVCEQLIVEARTYNVTLVNCFTKRKQRNSSLRGRTASPFLPY